MPGESNTIRFSERKVASPAFSALYGEGMELVEETAAYLDGEGRVQAKKLGRVTATLYAAESMRLTTRLMQMASWLLLQRALVNGEMTADQVTSEKGKIRLDTASSTQAEADVWRQLPAQFRDLVQRSLRLQARVRRMDIDLSQDIEAQALEGAAANPVSAQINLLRTAFGDR